MKKILLIASVVLLTHAAFSQGTITFGNRAGSSSTVAPGRVVAPVYGVNPSAPDRRISGNTSTGVPAGTQTYTGVPFLASDATHTYQATLWALNGPVVGDASANNLQQVAINGTAPFSTATSGILAGIWTQPSQGAVIVGATSETDRPTFQVRVWDTKGGTITTWDQALVAWQAGNNYALGYSDLFNVPYPLGATQSPPNQAPNMQGLTSFNVTTFPVPEPSVIALGVLGAGCLFLLRRRK